MGRIALEQEGPELESPQGPRGLVCVELVCPLCVYMGFSGNSGAPLALGTLALCLCMSEQLVPGSPGVSPEGSRGRPCPHRDEEAGAASMEHLLASAAVALVWETCRVLHDRLSRTGSEVLIRNSTNVTTRDAEKANGAGSQLYSHN